MFISTCASGASYTMLIHIKARECACVEHHQKRTFCAPRRSFGGGHEKQTRSWATRICSNFGFCCGPRTDRLVESTHRDRDAFLSWSIFVRMVALQRAPGCAGGTNERFVSHVSQRDRKNARRANRQRRFTRAQPRQRQERDDRPARPGCLRREQSVLALSMEDPERLCRHRASVSEIRWQGMESLWLSEARQSR